MKNIVKYGSFLNESVVNTERLNTKVLDILNEQIKNELNSSQMYRAMSTWLNDKKWPSGTKLFFKYADEELSHMSKIYNYIFDKNCKAIVPVVEKVKDDYKDIREVLEASLEHEIEVTKNWEEISALALSEKDHTTYEFVQWYISEQKEEELKIRTILEKMDLDMPNYEIDKLFGELLK